MTRDPIDDLNDRLSEISQGLQPNGGDPVEIIEEADVLILTTEMMHVAREDIRVDVSPSRVVIQTPTQHPWLGQARSRSVALPAEVRPEDSEAHFNNGVLEVFLPKRHAGGIGVHHVRAES